MIRTHLRRVKSAAWFGEPEFLGREPICVNTEGFGTGGRKKKETKKDMTASRYERGEIFTVDKRDSIARDRNVGAPRMNMTLRWTP